MQRVFRSRRQDSRRRAALAIERFYIRRRRLPADVAPIATNAAAAALAAVAAAVAPAWAGRGSLEAARALCARAFAVAMAATQAARLVADRVRRRTHVGL